MTTAAETTQYPTLRAKIAAEKAARTARYKAFADLMADAWRAGMEAGAAIRPTTMVVVEPSNPLDPSSPPRNVWREPEGPCGFAWVSVHPGTSSFARWLTKSGGAQRSYGGGVSIWISQFNQSVERKEACAEAMARVLKAAGINAYAGSRLD